MLVLDSDPGRGRAFDEQGRRLLAEARNLPDPLTGHGERLARRGEHGDPAVGCDQLVGEAGGSVDHVLAVVQHQQCWRVERSTACCDESSRPDLIFDAHASGDCSGDSGLRRLRGQIGEPEAAGKLCLHAGRHLDGEACLAAPSDTHDGHQPVIGQQSPQLGDLGSATEELRRHRRKAVPGHRGHPQGWVRALVELPHSQRIGDAAELELAQVVTARRRGKLPSHIGDEHLTRVPEIVHAGQAVDHRPEVVTVALHRCPDMDRDSHAERLRITPIGVLQSRRRGDGRIHRIVRCVERRDQSVAGVLEDRASSRLDHRLEHVVMKRESDGHRLEIGGPTRCRTDDVGHHEGPHPPHQAIMTAPRPCRGARRRCQGVPVVSETATTGREEPGFAHRRPVPER